MEKLKYRLKIIFFWLLAIGGFPLFLAIDIWRFSLKDSLSNYCETLAESWACFKAGEHV